MAAKLSSGQRSRERMHMKEVRNRNPQRVQQLAKDMTAFLL